MSLIEKIDAMKVKANKLIVNPPHDSLDEIANDISEGYITACSEIRDYILSEQKEPCTEPRLCPKCQGIMNYHSYFGKMICSQCSHIESTEPKPLTIGDKIRESNDSLSAFIRGQFGDDRVFHGGEQIDLDDYLNQPYTE